MKITHRLYNLRRKYFGTYSIDDPRPIKAESPYTFYLPEDQKLNSIEIGDSVKIVFRGYPAGLKHSAERMWVIISKTDGDKLVGILDNHPFDMPQLKAGDTIEFERFNVIDYKWSDPDKEGEFEQMPSKQRWERCLVDACVLNRSVPVSYLYREKPDMGKDDDEYPDSGWRIRGDVDLMTQEEYDNETAEYVALGAVLNKDDSWLHLIDEPTGSRFFKNKVSLQYEKDDALDT